jgi:hypothetical protein
MSLLYREPISGGKLFQAGIKEIPGILCNENIDLLILAAREYQPEFIDNACGGFTASKKVYIPMKDTIFFTPGKFKQTVKRANAAADLASDYLVSGKNVLSTCAAGWNRSGLISGLTLLRLTSFSGRQIVNLIKRNRCRSALSNPLFAAVIVNS